MNPKFPLEEQIEALTRQNILLSSQIKILKDQILQLRQLNQILQGQNGFLREQIGKFENKGLIGKEEFKTIQDRNLQWNMEIENLREEISLLKQKTENMQIHKCKRKNSLLNKQRKDVDSTTTCYDIILIGGTPHGQCSDPSPELNLLEKKDHFIIPPLRSFFSNKRFKHHFIVYRNNQQKHLLEECIKTHIKGDIKTISWVQGGETRMASVYQALQYINNNGFEKNAYVFIHDGSRPILPKRSIELLLKCLTKERGAALAHPMAETIVIVKENVIPAQAYFSSDESKIQLEEIVELPESREYVSRQYKWALETPQAFYFPKLFEDYTNLIAEDYSLLKRKMSPDFPYTDDTKVFSGPIVLINSQMPNPKINYPFEVEIYGVTLIQNIENFDPNNMSCNNA